VSFEYISAWSNSVLQLKRATNDPNIFLYVDIQSTPRQQYRVIYFHKLTEKFVDDFYAPPVFIDGKDWQNRVIEEIAKLAECEPRRIDTWH
jgi:hypothetical protein